MSEEPGSGARAAKEIFLDCLELEGSERSAHLERACAGDETLRERVLELLRAHEEARRELGEPERALLPGLAELAAGDRIGPYLLTERIGEGGFGVVFRAEQEAPLRRTVALKVLKLGMDTRSVVARFELERQALARMEHPAIARVFDAGATERGRPYFAMELVEGSAITRHCEAHGLGLRARLELFRTVCLAVQHAHHKGVIHRDIKPSNVLVSIVDGRAQPKVIDFGIAKAVEQPLSEESLRSREGALLGTPAYMSPEQAAGLEVDTRTDVYSLGVLLYELLVGAPPFDLAGLSLLEVQRAIVEREPLRPSTQRRRARAAGAEPTRPLAIADLPEELDWIALRCLEKAPGRRYPTAAALAADVERFLEHRPVEAVPPSALYRLRKLARRHRAASAAGALVLLALLLGVVGTSMGLVRERRAKEHLSKALATAEEQTERARAAELAAGRESRIASAINSFLVDDLLAAAAPSAERGRGLEVRLAEVLEVASRRIDEAAAPGGRFAGAPLVEAAIRATLGETFAALGAHAQALPHLERAHALRRAELGEDAPGTLRSASELGRSLHWLGRTEEALALLVPTLAVQERVLAPAHPDALETLARIATIRQAGGQVEEAAREFERALELARGRAGVSHAVLARVLLGLGLSRAQQERWEESRSLLREALELLLAQHGELHPDVLTARLSLGTLELFAGDPAAAEPLLRSAAQASRELNGPDHPATLAASGNLADALRGNGRPAEAAELLDEVVRGYERGFGALHELTLSARNALAESCAEAELWPKAAETLEQLAAACDELRGPQDELGLAVKLRLAEALERAGRADDARALRATLPD